MSVESIDVESVGVQWNRAVALGQSMSAEELAAEEKRFQFLADAKRSIDIARGRYNPTDSYITSERTLAVFRRLRDHRSPRSTSEILTVKDNSQRTCFSLGIYDMLS